MSFPTGTSARLSEKTVELNFCHQMSRYVGSPVWWFGTTQKQEQEAGWDIASRIQGSWAYFQLKASNKVLKSGARQFRGHHDQLVDLKKLATSPGEVFYVFPTIGTVWDLATVRFDLIPNLRFLDVDDIPTISPPTTATGALRKSEEHYFNLDPWSYEVTIHSDPVLVPVNSADTIGERIRLRRNETTTSRGDAEEAAERSLAFVRGSRNRFAAFLPAN